MPKGTIKYFDEGRGFGFIAPDDGSESVFVHISAIIESNAGRLKDGDRVSFEVRPSARKAGQFEAFRLQKLNAARADPPVRFGDI
jgi:CspA family cold shock protein